MTTDSPDIILTESVEEVLSEVFNEASKAAILHFLKNAKLIRFEDVLKNLKPLNPL